MVSTKKKAKLNLDAKLSKMEQLLKIINIDSCLLIYSYLMVFGKTTPAELRKVTGLSKATMFRNLALFSDAGILKKRDVKIKSLDRSVIRGELIRNTEEEDKKQHD